MIPRMKKNPVGSFREFNRYIKQCKSSWRRVNPSTRLAMTIIELIISFSGRSSVASHQQGEDERRRQEAQAH